MLKKAFVTTLGDNHEYQPVLSGKPQTCGMRSGRVCLEAGQDCGQHSTNAHEEILIFLSGQGEALIGEGNTSYPVGKGKVLYIPPHTPHDIRNPNDEPLVYIYCVAPITNESEEPK